MGLCQIHVTRFPYEIANKLKLVGYSCVSLHMFVIQIPTLGSKILFSGHHLVVGEGEDGLESLQAHIKKLAPKQSLKFSVCSKNDDSCLNK